MKFQTAQLRFPAKRAGFRVPNALMQVSIECSRFRYNYYKLIKDRKNIAEQKITGLKNMEQKN